MQAEHRKSYATIERAIDLTDGPDRVTVGGRPYRIQTVAITYTWDEQKRAWEVTRTTRIRLIGGILKKDGTPGKVEYEGWPDHRFIRNPETIPWLARVVDAYRPWGAPGGYTGNIQHDLKGDL